MKTMIIDNFLPNADWLVNYSTSLEFRRRGEGEYFEGERSGELHAERKQMTGSICRRIIEEYYGIKDFNYNADLYFHKTSEVDLQDPQWLHDRIHTDKGMIAGLIYLTKDAPLDCGTQTYHNSLKPDIVMGNRYNRLVVYPCEKEHSAMNYFNTRLVLLFWLNGLEKN